MNKIKKYFFAYIMLSIYLNKSILYDKLLKITNIRMSLHIQIFIKRKLNKCKNYYNKKNVFIFIILNITLINKR